jgi:GDP-6-deoxy-D-talose 4-dehydrogenase
VNKRILITGITGFTGRYVARKFVELGCEVYGFSHANNRAIEGVKQIYTVSLNNYNDIKQAVNSIKPHYVIHLAAISFVAHTNISELYETNVIGTRNLLEALKTANFLAENVIVASSANVYGNNDSGQPLDESTLLAPVNDYAVTKVSGEYISSLYSHVFPITVVRPFNYTGLFQNNNFLVPKIVQAAKTRQPIIELGNLDVARDFSDVRDVARFYSELVQSANINQLRTINICSGNSYTLEQILEYAQQAANHRFDEILVNPSFVRTNEIKLLVGDPKKLNAAVLNRERFSLEQTIKWMVSN